MTREELEKRAKEYARKEVYYGAYIDEEAGMEIVEEVYIEATERETKLLQKRIEELEAQIEKMKNCKNCANYMISGKCPSFFRTGWCKNWEMTRSKK